MKGITDAMCEMCSPPMLQWIRDLLVQHDNLAWFLGWRDAFITALPRTKHGIGPLLLYNVLHNHPTEKGCATARTALGRLGSDEGLTPATAIFNKVPREATSISGLIGPIFQLAHGLASRWPVDQFKDYLSRPSFAEAASTVIFFAHGPNAYFRPQFGEFLTLDGTLELETGDVSVAGFGFGNQEAKISWAEHLADHDIVQPWQQLRL